MKSSLLQGLVVLVVIASAIAYPYEAEDEEPIYDGEPERYVRLVPLRRLPRAALRPQQHPREKLVFIPEGGPIRSEPQFNPQQRSDFVIPVPSHKEPVAAESGYGHSSQPNDYVDYGAYTGGYGAFGWYSDHPVGNYR